MHHSQIRAPLAQAISCVVPSRRRSGRGAGRQRDRDRGAAVRGQHSMQQPRPDHRQRVRRQRVTVEHPELLGHRQRLVAGPAGPARGAVGAELRQQMAVAHHFQFHRRPAERDHQREALGRGGQRLHPARLTEWGGFARNRAQHQRVILQHGAQRGDHRGRLQRPLHRARRRGFLRRAAERQHHQPGGHQRLDLIGDRLGDHRDLAAPAQQRRGVDPVGPQPAQHAAMPPARRPVAKHSAEELGVAGDRGARHLDVAALRLDHDERQGERAQRGVEVDPVAAIAVADPHFGEVGAIQVGRRLADHLVVQQCLHRQPVARVRRIRPAGEAGRGDDVKRAANVHPASPSEGAGRDRDGRPASAPAGSARASSRRGRTASRDRRRAA